MRESDIKWHIELAARRRRILLGAALLGVKYLDGLAAKSEMRYFYHDTPTSKKSNDFK